MISGHPSSARARQLIQRWWICGSLKGNCPESRRTCRHRLSCGQGVVGIPVTKIREDKDKTAQVDSTLSNGLRILETNPESSSRQGFPGLSRDLGMTGWNFHRLLQVLTKPGCARRTPNSVCGAMLRTWLVGQVRNRPACSTEMTITSVARLEEDMERTSRRGHAVDRGEFRELVYRLWSGIMLPIGEINGALGCRCRISISGKRVRTGSAPAFGTLFARDRISCVSRARPP